VPISERLAEVEAGYAVEATGLRLLGEPTKPRWTAIGHDLVRRGRGLQWAVADWLLLYRGEWGAMYADAAAITGYSEIHLAHMARVGRQWPPARRGLVDLPWTYWLLAVNAPDPDAALRWAAQARMGTAKFATWVSDQNQTLRPDHARSRATRDVRARRLRQRGPCVLCPHCRHVFPIAGHRVPKGDES
jgi:hypothetical protein